MGLPKETREETTDEAVRTDKIKIQTPIVKKQTIGKIYWQCVPQKKKKKKLSKVELNQSPFWLAPDT